MVNLSRVRAELVLMVLCLAAMDDGPPVSYAFCCLRLYEHVYVHMDTRDHVIQTIQCTHTHTHTHAHACTHARTHVCHTHKLYNISAQMYAYTVTVSLLATASGPR